jgi:tetratricopeptide (TPR) repeat protein
MHRLITVTLLVCAPLCALAQSKEEPKRPRLPAGADTNDAHVYYAYGLEQLRRQPDVAANAFYWAMMLNPVMGDAFYARRVALLLTDRRRLTRYWNEEKSTLRSAEIKRIDSLYLHALTLNPFLYEKLDQLLFRAIIDEFVNEQSLRTGTPAGELQFAVNSWLMRAGPGTKAWQAYGEGRFQDALEEWARAIKAAKYKYGYRSMRGRLFFQLNEVDSAFAELNMAVEEMRKLDNKDLVFVYQSKALYEHSLGMVHERRGEMKEAREAYARALQEDLGYSPAHMRLAYMALDQKDTTTALSEFDLAVQLRPNDPGLRYQYGYILSLTQRSTEAAEQLDKAIAMNPWFALPYHALAELYDRQGKKTEAINTYRIFLALASRQDTRRGEAIKRIEALSTGD